MSYFAEALDRTALGDLSSFGSGLYSCQKGALMAVCAHFSASDRPAIVSMPTGSGKTEVMIALAFVLGAQRVLVIEPATVLRRQTAERFRRMSIFRQLGVVCDELGPPNSRCVEHICGDREDWASFREHDVVVATPKTVSPAEEWVCDPPDDGLFDLLLFDEAHHITAKTWRAIMSAFPAARVVLLTATPFRRDRRKLPGDLVYHYSIGNALDDGIYRPVRFHSVPYHAREEECDEALAEAAALLLADEREQGSAPQILVRVDEVDWADRLVPIYQSTGLHTEAIHYRKTTRQNAAALGAFRQGELDALICVGMLTEGLDVPSIKIAVLHAPPQSLPYTIQLIGRVSRRPSDQTGPAHLVAIPDKVSGEVQSLYREERDWRRLVPELVDEVLRRVYRDRSEALTASPSGLAILPEDFTPFFSVTLYEWSPRGDDLSRGMDLEELSAYRGMPNSVEACFHLPDYCSRCTVLVTQKSAEPAWGKSTDLFETTYDLHVFYAPSDNVLAVATTSDLICESLLGRIAPNRRLLAPERLAAALQSVTLDGYIAVGLDNATGLTGPHPSYRVHMGRGSGTSVRPSDGRVFGAGHAIGRVDDVEIRGIATQSRKAWAMRRDAFGEFVDWCDAVAGLIAGREAVLPGLQFLAKPRAAEPLTDEPVAVLLDDFLASNPRAIRVREARDAEAVGNIDPFIRATGLSDGVLECELFWREEAAPIALSCCPVRDPVWEQTDRRTVRTVIHRRDTQVEDVSLSSYLRRNPPTLVMPSEGIIRGNLQWILSDRRARMPDGCLQVRDWDGCDITTEAQPGAEGQMNVQEATLTFLLDDGSPRMVVVKDDASYEIADFIAVEPRRRPRLISFVHCKATSGDPGYRLDDLKELLNQGCRSHLWIRDQGLVAELCERLSRRRSCAVVDGLVDDLLELRGTYERNEWNFRVILVQPGTRVSDLERRVGRRAYVSVLAAYEWIAAAGAKLELWGS